MSRETHPYTGRPLIGIPVGNSNYVIIRAGKIIRAAQCCGAVEARAKLRPLKSKGEHLFIEVGSR